MPTKIEWATETWNPVTGCTKISEGCQNCYAERMSKRLAGRCGYPKDNPFQVTFHPDKLDEPLRWRKPSRIFVCSMGDLFHEDVPEAWIFDIYTTMERCSQHTFLLLTKKIDRAARILHKFTGRTWPLPNVWLGVTAENQARANERIPILLQIPATKRFVSVEPMLGPVDLTKLTLGPNGHGLDFCLNSLTGWSTVYPKGTDRRKIMRNDEFTCLDWVICGGETGPGARPMHPDWVRSLRDQCQAAGTSFFFKSWGDWQEGSALDTNAKHMIVLNSGETVEPGHELSISQREKWQYLRPCMMSRVGKKNAGRLLDGQTWEQRP